MENIKIGDDVQIVNCAEARSYENNIFKVVSEPYEICGCWVVKIKCEDTGKYFGGGFNSDKLLLVK